MASVAPENEREYPIVLGKSLKSRSSKTFYSFRYDFIPQFMDIEMPGSMTIDETRKAMVQFQHPKNEDKKISFVGAEENLDEKDAQNLQCMLIFDAEAECFVLERLSAHISSLKYQKKGSKTTGTFNNSRTTSSEIRPAKRARNSPTKSSIDSAPTPAPRTLSMLSQPKPTNVRPNVRPKPTNSNQWPRSSALNSRSSSSNSSSSSSGSSTGNHQSISHRPPTYFTNLAGEVVEIPGSDGGTSDSESDSDSSSSESD